MRNALHRLSFFVLATVVLAGGCASGKPDATPVGPCRAAPPKAGQTTQTFDFQGQKRTFQAYVPRSVATRRTPMPVVFNFHGYGSNAAEQMVYGDFRKLADANRFLIIAPDGQSTPRHYNITFEPGLQDDVAMATALLDHLEQTLCVDAKRVFSTGFSDGGAMTSALACRAPDRFAAFAAVAVVVYLPGCGGTANIPIIAFAGTADPVVPFAGGTVNCCGNPTLPSASDAMRGWAGHDGCRSDPVEHRLSTEVRRQDWQGCRPGSEVSFYIIDGGGHTWPGAISVPTVGATTNQIDASRTIWDFFASHS